jgi:cold shock CspA family protein
MYQHTQAHSEQFVQRTANESNATQPTTRGVVKKIFSAEGFGFIETEISGDIFFHKTQSPEFKTLAVGDHVTLDTVMTKKGQAAKNVSICKPEFYSKMVEGLLFTKNNHPKRGKIIAKQTVTSGWFSSPQDGRDKLKNIAAEFGCNAVLSLECKREVFPKDYNYYGTYHNFTADIAIVVEDLIVPSDKEKAVWTKYEAELAIDNAKEKFDTYASVQAEKSKKVSPNSNLLGLIIVIPLLLGFIGMLSQL